MEKRQEVPSYIEHDFEMRWQLTLAYKTSLSGGPKHPMCETSGRDKKPSGRRAKMATQRDRNWNWRLRIRLVVPNGDGWGDVMITHSNRHMEAELSTILDDAWRLPTDTNRHTHTKIHFVEGPYRWVACPPTVIGHWKIVIFWLEWCVVFSSYSLRRWYTSSMIQGANVSIAQVGTVSPQHTVPKA